MPFNSFLHCILTNYFIVSPTVSKDGYSYGGGGGFIQSRVRVSPGEKLTIQVGSGGKFNGLDFDNVGKFGFNRGGKGGTSVSGPHAGSGGGYSAVLRSNGDLILLAGGGGAGGATDYCCAHGGPGSGSNGEKGNIPNTPILIEGDTESMPMREFPRNITQLDQKSCSGGEGGRLTSPGDPGYSASNSIMHDDIKVGALRGESFIGGKGSDGKEGGGGGGSGFFGGSGGGSGFGKYPI